MNGGRNKLELDGYCAELGLAFEHQGKQHYNPVQFKGKTYEFKKLCENDKIKIELCRNRGIKLFIIPELFNMTALDDLIPLIKFQCMEMGVVLPDVDSIKVDLSRIYNTNRDRENLEK